MKNIGNIISRSIIKQQEALERFQTIKRDYFFTRDQIRKDIEEAKKIWRNTLEQLPKQEFNQ
jgi:hypothetical protein